MITTDAVPVPAGTYWVGDPCYAFDNDDELWLELLASAEEKEEDPAIYVAEASNGQSFVACQTAYGDGTYLDGQGREFLVDAGMIGVVKARPNEAVPHGMHEVTFPSDFFVRYVEGIIHIDSLIINTVNPQVPCQDCGTFDDWLDDYDRCINCTEEED